MQIIALTLAEGGRTISILVTGDVQVFRASDDSATIVKTSVNGDVTVTESPREVLELLKEAGCQLHRSCLSV